MDGLHHVPVVHGLFPQVFVRASQADLPGGTPATVGAAQKPGFFNFWSFAVGLEQVVGGNFATAQTEVGVGVRHDEDAMCVTHVVVLGLDAMGRLVDDGGPAVLVSDGVVDDDAGTEFVLPKQLEGLPLEVRELHVGQIGHAQTVGT